MAQTSNSAIIARSIWMIVISFVLFFLPAIKGLIGGGDHALLY
jgi:hypothetical protein